MEPSPPNSLMQQETPPAAEDATPLATETALKLPNRLLVAEDARCVQVNLASILGRLHVKAEMVENGRLACDLVEKSKADGKPYDLILMDMQMPQMNGYKAVEWIRQQGWQGPIVAISALASEKDHEKIMKAGCDDYVSKPVNETKLRYIFSKHLGGKTNGTTPAPNAIPDHRSHTE